MPSVCSARAGAPARAVEGASRRMARETSRIGRPIVVLAIGIATPLGGQSALNLGQHFVEAEFGRRRALGKQRERPHVVYFEARHAALDRCFTCHGVAANVEFPLRESVHLRSSRAITPHEEQRLLTVAERWATGN